MKMFVERIWEDGKAELINLDNGTVLLMHEGYASCWFLDVEVGGKVRHLLENNSITIIRKQYNAVKEQWTGGKTVVTVTDV